VHNQAGQRNRRLYPVIEAQKISARIRYSKTFLIRGQYLATLESFLLVSLKRRGVLIAGFLAPFAAAGIVILIGACAERWANGRFRVTPLTLGATVVLASSIPFLIVVVLATRERRTHRISWSGILGLFFAVVSLVVPIFFLYGTILIWLGMRHEAARNIPAPDFQALDIHGKKQRLGDHKGDVVLVNVWSTWCGPCLAEMPRLDHLYQQHKDQGLIVFGLSDEDPTTQRKALTRVPVTYPLLTYDGQIPSFYRYVAGIPTTYVIDRRGIVHCALMGDETFEKLDNTVVSLLTGQP